MNDVPLARLRLELGTELGVRVDFLGLSLVVDGLRFGVLRHSHSVGRGLEILFGTAVVNVHGAALGRFDRFLFCGEYVALLRLVFLRGLLRRGRKVQ